MTIAAARRVASLAGRDFDRLAAAALEPRAHAVVLNATANISVKSTIRDVVSSNVVARVEGSDPRLKDEYVVYSAHGDHLGRDQALAGDQIYNGAIDNAVGTAQLLEIARGFAALRRKPKRSILFIAVTAEEKGFLGSRFYAQHPLFPIAKTIADINLDGGNVWGLTSDLITTGYGLSTLDEALGEAARLQGRTLVKEPMTVAVLRLRSNRIRQGRHSRCISVQRLRVCRQTEGVRRSPLECLCRQGLPQGQRRGSAGLESVGGGRRRPLAVDRRVPRGRLEHAPGVEAESGTRRPRASRNWLAEKPADISVVLCRGLHGAAARGGRIGSFASEINVLGLFRARC